MDLNIVLLTDIWDLLILKSCNLSVFERESFIQCWMLFRLCFSANPQQ